MRSELPDELKGSIRYPGTIADLTKHYEIIMNVIHGDKVKNETHETLEQKALSVIEELLDSTDPEICLKAAEVILNR